MKVCITGDIPKIGIDLLHRNNIETVVNKSGKLWTQNQIIKASAKCHGLITLLADNIDNSIIENLKDVKIIANYAVGYNNIDLNAAKSQNIVVTNTPGVLTDSTADLAMALVLACARRVGEGEALVRSNKFTGWMPKLLLGQELKNKKFGIIGAGRIGSAVASRAKSFGTGILYHSRSKNSQLEKETGAKKVSLDTLLKTSDIISLHIPLTPVTRNLLNKEKLALLKTNAILINTARGEIVDELELISMLKNKKIFSAGFDVYVNEPVINKKLYKLKNTVLLPHLGSATIEARNEMALLAVKNVIAVLKGKKPLTPVN